MTLYKIVGNCSVYHGDNRDVLKTLPDNSIDSCVTDPPYALVSIVKRFGGPNAAPAKGNDAYARASAGFMGKQWDTGEVAFSEEFWAEVLRVLKPGGHVAAFGASRGYHRMACAIEDAGFEIRDSLMWVYGTGFPKSHSVSRALDAMAGAERPIVGTTKSGGFARIMQTNAEAGFRPDNYYEEGNTFRSNEPITDAARQWEGWGTALKPAFEPIVLARKPLSEKTVAANVLLWGTGALNIDGCRVNSGPVEKHVRTANVTGANSMAGVSTGSTGSGEFVAGRWPANVVHDGSDEVVGAFPDTGPSSGRPRHNGEFKSVAKGRDLPHTTHGHTDDGGSAARFFYSAKASKADRNGSKHPTVKPIALMQWLARLITPPGGTVLDPFAGSGTTGAACEREGFRCVLVERETEYVQDIVRRLSAIKDHSEKNRVDNDQPQFEMDI